MKVLFSSLLVFLTVPSALFVQAVPTPRDRRDSMVIPRDTPSASLSPTDEAVLQFAHLLELLEDKFYQEALARFNATAFEEAGFKFGDVPVQQIQDIEKDEHTHTFVLGGALESAGATPLSCNFNFSDALQTVGTMIATARVLEMGGTSAYGGALHLFNDPVLLTKAGTIMSNEGRHNTVLNIISGPGTAIPSPFDMALNTSEVLALVEPFFDGPCNTNITPNPTLTITNRGDPTTGTTLTFSSTAFDNSSTNLFCQLLTGNLTETVPLPLNDCQLPYGLMGPIYAWVTYGGDPLPNDVIARSLSSHVVAGPALFYVDMDSQALGMAAVGDLPAYDYGSWAEDASTSSYSDSPTSTYGSWIADASPSSYGYPYGCWFHGRPCQGSSQ